MGTGIRTEEFSEWRIAEPLINGGDMIFGDGGRGEIDSGSGVMGNGEINGVKTFLLGEGGMGDMGGDIDIPGL